MVITFLITFAFGKKEKALKQRFSKALIRMVVENQ